jgi:glycosyltransferase involved in cell wall biosynthesis
MQKTTFTFEILIHDDASTDSTPYKVKCYEDRFPFLFRCVYQKENQFNIQNTLTNILIPMSRGKYIALCEGDDYWTDPYKLQKQVDFLEKSPNYVISFHQSQILHNDKLALDFIGVPRDLDWQDIFSGIVIPTQTVLFRKVFAEFPKEFELVSNGDTFLFCLLAQYGDAKFMNNINPSVYRIHDSGVWSSITIKNKYFTSLSSMVVIHNFFNGKYRKPLTERIVQMNVEASLYLALPDFLNYSLRTFLFLNKNLYLNKNLELFKTVSRRVAKRLKKWLFQ